MIRSTFLFAMVVGLGTAVDLSAQRPLTLSLGGGASIPAGQLKDGADIGWHALASIGLSSLMQPIGLRADVVYNRFGAKTTGPDQAISSATLNASYRLPMTNSPISPYIIAGAGAYRSECAGGVDCGSSTDFGWNAGAGFKFAAMGFKGFVESRFHAVNASSANLRFVPVTLALTF